MVSLLVAAISLTQVAPSVAVKGGKILPIRSFEVGTSDDLAKLKASKADLLIVRFKKWGPKPEETAKALQNGPSGRRVVLVEFPALGVNPNNVLLWRSDWDTDNDGKLDRDAPTWLRPKNEDGFFPVDTSNIAARNRIVGSNGLVSIVAKAGFDGVVVSSVKDPLQKPGFDARLVTDVLIEGRKKRGSFLVFLRNPGKLMDYPAIRTLLDGFIADGIFFGSDEIGMPSDEEFVADSVKRLEWAAKRQKVVLSIGYTNDPEQIAENRKLALERRFIPLTLPKRLEYAPITKSSSR